MSAVQICVSLYPSADTVLLCASLTTFWTYSSTFLGRIRIFFRFELVCTPPYHENSLPKVSLTHVFQLSTPVLSVTENFKRTDGTDFDPDTIKNIKNAHREFSHGIVVGGRNVVAHEVVSDLKDSGLFTEKDCLDALSLLSHLFYRLDRSTKMTP